MYLAIDTSTETAGLALIGADGALRSELTWHAGRNHTAELHPALRGLLAQAGLTPGGVTGVVVARGPGSFTGIRVGMATAKGLAFGLGVPIVGVRTLEVAAYPFLWPGREPTVWAVVDAGRGQVAAAAFQSDGDDGWRDVMEEAILTPEELCDAIADTDGEAILCGEVPQAVAEMVPRRLDGQAVIPPAVHRLRRAVHLAAIGWRRLRAGDADDVGALAPLYLRRPAAVEKQEGR